MVVTVNNLKLKDIAYSTFPQEAAGTYIGGLFQSAYDQLERISEQSGCKCKQKKPRLMVYSDLFNKLRDTSEEDIQTLKTFLNAETLIFTSEDSGKYER